MTRPKPDNSESTPAHTRPVTAATPASIEGYVRALGRVFYASGHDREDIEQEARIGAWLAPAGLERVVARRRVLDLVNKANRRRLEFFPEEYDPPSRIDVVEVVAARERLRRLAAVELSPVQREAVRRVVIDGEAYAGDKRIDNALYAARQKFRKAVGS